MPIAVISSSLRPGSRSRALAIAAKEHLESLGETVTFLDLQEHTLPLCDGGAAYGDPEVSNVSKMLDACDRYIVATAIYNYDANSALKNLVELTGKDIWEDKIVGFLCAAGGNSSYMSIMALANSLMLDFRCWIVPRFVYTTGDAFQGEELANENVKKRIKDLCEVTLQVQV